MDDRFVPAGEARNETSVSNSRFIACAAPAATVESARNFIDAIKEAYPGASHHVPAFIIGHGANIITHCSDAGEPSGTAGRPVLSVLTGSGLGDIAVVVVRYFGGTKLGTGGLVRAYTEACQQVLAILPRGVKVSTTTLIFELEYAQLAVARRLVNAHEGEIIDEDFQANIWMTARFRTDRVAAFEDALVDFSRGRIHPEVLEINPDSFYSVSSGGGWSQVSPGTGDGRKK